MTKDTNGEFPFDGNIGPGFEQFYHEWRIYPFSDIVVQDANQHQSDSSLKLSLEGMENSIYKSWQEMANVESRSAVGGNRRRQQLAIDIHNPLVGWRADREVSSIKTRCSQTCNSRDFHKQLINLLNRWRGL